MFAKPISNLPASFIFYLSKQRIGSRLPFNMLVKRFKRILFEGFRFQKYVSFCQLYIQYICFLYFRKVPVQSEGYNSNFLLVNDEMAISSSFCRDCGKQMYRMRIINIKELFNVTSIKRILLYRRVGKGRCRKARDKIR